MLNLTAEETLVLIARIIGLIVAFQSLEFLKIKDSISETGIWRWSEIRSGYLFLPPILITFLDWIMAPKIFMEMMKWRFTFGLIVFLYPYLFLLFVFLFFTTFLITIRWRGSFNGGSDYLLLIILLCLAIGFKNPRLEKAALAYLALQVICSYFLAGVYKIRQKKWRNGASVFGFISSPNYQVPRLTLNLSRDPIWAKFISWGVMLYELTFPLSILHPNLLIIYLALGLLFHLGNFVTFGLNRFFWVWISSYPAIYYCSQLLN
jgi:hypothetical protein